MKLISVIVALFVVFQEFALALPPTSLRAIENATMFKLRNAFGKDSDTTLQPTDPCCKKKKKILTKSKSKSKSNDQPKCHSFIETFFFSNHFHI